MTSHLFQPAYPNAPARHHVLLFGKYRGTRLSQVPGHYLAWLLRSQTLDEDLRRLIFETTLESADRRVGVDQATYEHALTLIAPTPTAKRTRKQRKQQKPQAPAPTRTQPDHRLYFPHLKPKESSDAKRR
ncbi:MAG TPA: DUF3820 family protein [Sporichthya sp.]|jgi:Putative quorum-sensing-regulated virulence factor|nr:DUF3820 family protein [Sporichthya sp.]